MIIIIEAFSRLDDVTDLIIICDLRKGHDSASLNLLDRPKDIIGY